MGLLSVGTPLEWKDAEKYSDHVRKHGIEVSPLLSFPFLDRLSDIS